MESQKTQICGTWHFGKEYLSWILDVEIHLDAMNLGVTIKEGNQASL